MLKIDYKKCTGCTACSNICPKEAIKFQEDEKGFKYPIVMKDLCVECHLCEKVCNMHFAKSSDRLPKPEYYIAQHNDPKELSHCQSGGASFAIGEVIINKHGIVYGAQYENCTVVHKSAETIEELIKTCGSKYVQSDLRNCFMDIYYRLQKGKQVLFSGTSCQVDGLYRFLEAKNADITNLYTVDIICHGVPSPKILRDYISFIEKKTGISMISVNMRDRRYAPVTTTVFTAQDGRKFIDNNYIDLFYTNIVLRECCGHCRFTTRDKPADITIGDTIGTTRKELINPLSPSSLVIIHSLKGKVLFDKCNMSKVKISESEFSQPNLSHPTRISPQREKFWNQYLKHGIKYVLKRYTSYGGITTKIKRRIMLKLKKW